MTDTGPSAIFVPYSSLMSFSDEESKSLTRLNIIDVPENIIRRSFELAADLVEGTIALTDKNYLETPKAVGAAPRFPLMGRRFQQVCGDKSTVSDTSSSQSSAPKKIFPASAVSIKATPSKATMVMLRH